MRQVTNTTNNWKAVIPTRNDRPQLLRNLTTTIGPDRVVVVHTADTTKSPDIDGCCNIRYQGPRNIQEWWRTGITAAGTRYIALVNDDVEMTINPIPTMVGACWKLNRAMARVRGPGIPHSGWLFVIDTNSGVTPDPAYRWWYGDNDMYRQAEQRGGIIDIPVTGIKHHDLGQYATKPEYRAAILADRDLYTRRWSTRHG